MNKNLRIGVIAILLVGIGFFVLTKQNFQPSAPVTNSEPQPSPSVITEQKIRLIGTIKWLNPSDPAQYSYELTLEYPFYDELQSTGQPYMSKMPILSRDKVLQAMGYVTEIFRPVQTAASTMPRVIIGITSSQVSKIQEFYSNLREEYRPEIIGLQGINREVTTIGLNRKSFRESAELLKQKTLATLDIIVDKYNLAPVAAAR